MKKLPDKFVEKYNEILGETKANKLFEWLLRPIKPSIRVNTLKVEPSVLKEMLENHYGWTLEETPIEYAFRLNVENPGASLEAMAGFYYVQEISSMLPPIVLDPRPNEKVLDIAAAPGSKTTHIGQLMDNTGGILANEASRGRIAILYNNVKRFGLVNVRVRLGDGRRIPGKDIFDRALVDVPCSSEATIQRTWMTTKRWSPEFIDSLVPLQKKLLASAVKLVKPGGRIVYSTCTFEPVENEEVIDWALENLPVKSEKIHLDGFPVDRGLPGYECSKDVIRIWPWSEMEGFFIASLVKEG